MMKKKQISQDSKPIFLFLSGQQVQRGRVVYFQDMGDIVEEKPGLDVKNSTPEEKSEAVI